MAFNGDETEAVGEAHKPNSYFEAFDGIVAALDALAKAVTPDGGDDGTPPEEGARPCCNSYFASFRNITDALARLKSAVEERIAAGGGIEEESDPVFRKWRDEGYSIGLGKGANVTSNGVAIGWNSSAGSGTGSGSNDSGAVAVGKAAQAWGIGAASLGKGAVAGSTSARTTLPTVQLGAGQNAENGTLQFRDWQLVGADGTIPLGRLPAGLTSFDIKTPFIDHTGAQLYDKAVNVYSFYGPSTAQAFKMPPKTAGKARSFMLRLTMTVATEWSLPQDVHYESDDENVFAEIEAGTTAVFMFAETSDNLFMVSRKNVRLVSKG